MGGQHIIAVQLVTHADFFTASTLCGHYDRVHKGHHLHPSALCREGLDRTLTNTLAGCSVIVYEHLAGTLSVGYGPHLVARFNAEGIPLPQLTRRRKAVEKTVASPPWKTLRVSHAL